MESNRQSNILQMQYRKTRPTAAPANNKENPGNQKQTSMHVLHLSFSNEYLTRSIAEKATNASTTQCNDISNCANRKKSHLLGKQIFFARKKKQEKRNIFSSFLFTFVKNYRSTLEVERERFFFFQKERFQPSENVMCSCLKEGQFEPLSLVLLHS